LNIEAIEPFGEWLAAGIVLTNENLSRYGLQMDSWATVECDI
jgi:hypothetical protein